MRTSNYFRQLAIAIAILLLPGCGQRPGLAEAREKLLALHSKQQDAHLHKNAKQFVEQFAENMVSVNRGKISVVPRDSALKRFQNYFRDVEFIKWEDVNPPVIEFSADASMAYMLVDKLVVLTYKGEGKGPVEETTHFAWISVFKKQPDGEWKIVCNVSTNEPAVKK
ncbi:MAG TPA: nuclear transport factor 2 family protein [Ferruginibacter sp.]|nr:nuclear transport factor 2 family protein [Ferruginibacter sp.]HNH22984.1 nuclear transport factor 2 family protein [Ferruginibacter sp.]HNP00329.1 nuclear transport factor 2 family protein [Ferruginibacter sp.]HQR01661.1 nuclear transport factor 2 family protein [Ferruginibacter sp.]